MSNAYDELRRRNAARQYAEEVVSKRQCKRPAEQSNGYDQAIKPEPWSEPSDDYKRATGLPVENTPEDQDSQDQLADAMKQPGDLGFK